ncbi:MAG: aspartyl protease family protein [Defluviitaleaceae bacterium]|nr:aspartyl protease family protein [Defluviitaleaceae bacterium]
MAEGRFILDYNISRYVFQLGVGIRLPLIINNEETTIIDTGLRNTTCPLAIAKKYGKKKNHSQQLIIGGRTYTTTLYTLNYTYFGDYLIKNLPVFVGDFKGDLSRNIILGCSVLKNWDFKIKSSTNELFFKEISAKYNNFFDENGDYTEILLEETDETEE